MVFSMGRGFRGKFPLNRVVTCVADRVQIIPMKHWFLDLDRLLRGDATRTATLRERGVDFSSGGLIGAVLILGVFYGVCMGSYAVVSGRGGGWLQMLAAMFKVPSLFLLTLVVTFPSP